MPIFNKHDGVTDAEADQVGTYGESAEDMSYDQAEQATDYELTGEYAKQRR